MRAARIDCTLCGKPRHRGRIERDARGIRLDDAALEEEAHDLFGKKRIAFGLGGDECAERLGQLVDAEAGLRDAESFARGQRIEGEPASRWRAPPTAANRSVVSYAG